METAHIYQRLTMVFRDVFDDPSLTLTPFTTASDVQGWDSVAHINLAVGIEQKLGITFRGSELEALRNIGELVGLIEYKLEGERDQSS